MCSDGFVVSHRSSVDDIVLGYIVSVLEQLGEDEQFDVDEFAEIMAAYIPGFDTVNKYVTVCTQCTYSPHFNTSIIQPPGRICSALAWLSMTYIIIIFNSLF